ncbi:hypothetical protein C5B96_01875 [Subtercola sp. Z020]|uniref:hypothetical protein n=1 Tax=Subtercola sp. Z020 TaxID=2080582 RepID=UPI000CE81329|nr:hypothetical protein [Subtercola sp. Z020]PPF88992.1 hypothetical protein C5B96_01875 [Subtercola sp. Z020]
MLPEPIADAAADPAAQTHYQVRFGRGPAALDTVASHADVVIWVDALPEPPAAGATPAVPVAPTLDGIPIIHADLRNRSNAARWMLEQQVLAGRRVSVAVVAAADSVEDTLAAGAVIDALAALGIDFSSPEAAVACASFTALQRAVGHLLTASVAGRALIAAGHAAVVADASGIDSQPPVVA